MGITFARVRRTGVVPMECVAAITAATLSGCSFHTDDNELIDRHFVDIAELGFDNTHDRVLYYATVGTCRLKLLHDTSKHAWYVVDENNTPLLAEPTADMVRNDHRWDYCSHNSPPAHSGRG